MKIYQGDQLSNSCCFHAKKGSTISCSLKGPGGIWCDVDVVEFAYYGDPVIAPKEQVYTELVEGLRGGDPCIGPGSQV